MSQRCVAEIDKLMRTALRPVLVPVPCLAARVSPAACPWRLRSRPCVPSPAVGVPGLGLVTTVRASLSLSSSLFLARINGTNGTSGTKSTRGISLSLSLSTKQRDTDQVPDQSKANTITAERKRKRKLKLKLRLKLKRRLKFRREPRSSDFPTVCCALLCLVLCLLCLLCLLCWCVCVSPFARVRSCSWLWCM